MKILKHILKKVIIRIIPELKPIIGKTLYWKRLQQEITKSNISCDAKIFGRCNIYQCSIGRFSYVGDNASMSFTTVGKFCSIGPNFICGYGIHPLDGISTSPAFFSATNKSTPKTFSSTNKIEERKPITIGNDVWIGMNVCVLDGVNIGDGAIIGAGAIVTKDVASYAIVGGVPAKKIKMRFDEDTIQKLQETKWWDADDEVLQKVEKHFYDPTGFINEFNLTS